MKAEILYELAISGLLESLHRQAKEGSFDTRVTCTLSPGVITRLRALGYTVKTITETYGLFNQHSFDSHYISWAD